LVVCWGGVWWVGCFFVKGAPRCCVVGVEETPGVGGPGPPGGGGGGGGCRPKNKRGRCIIIRHRP